MLNNMEVKKNWEWGSSLGRGSKIKVVLEWSFSFFLVKLTLFLVLIPDQVLLNHLSSPCLHLRTHFHSLIFHCSNFITQTINVDIFWITLGKLAVPSLLLYFQPAPNPWIYKPYYSRLIFKFLLLFLTHLNLFEMNYIYYCHKITIKHIVMDDDSSSFSHTHTLQIHGKINRLE